MEAASCGFVGFELEGAYIEQNSFPVLQQQAMSRFLRAGNKKEKSCQ